MKEFFKEQFPKDFYSFTVYDVTFDEKTGEVTIKFEPFENQITFDKDDFILSKPIYTKHYVERANENDRPVIHTLSFKDKYCLDYFVDGNTDNLAYESFCDILTSCDYSDYSINILGEKRPINDTVFKYILEYCQYEDREKIIMYGDTITINSMTSLWLQILKNNHVSINYNELNKLLIPKIDNMMTRYLRENTEYVERFNQLQSEFDKLTEKITKNEKDSQPNK